MMLSIIDGSMAAEIMDQDQADGVALLPSKSAECHLERIRDPNLSVRDDQQWWIRREPIFITRHPRLLIAVTPMKLGEFIFTQN
jgi:hypothetical protein